jgi:putative endonuclease
MSTNGSHTSEDPRHVLGRLGEDLALAHLSRLGFALLGRNERTRFGEIDLIVCDGRTILFVEVKTTRIPRRDTRRPVEPPLARLGSRQQARLRRLATAWLCDKTRMRPWARNIRFDAIGVLVDSRGRLVRLDHIENAF